MAQTDSRQLAESPGRRFRHQGLPLRKRRVIAGIAAALPNSGRAAARCGRADRQPHAAVGQHRHPANWLRFVLNEVDWGKGNGKDEPLSVYELVRRGRPRATPTAPIPRNTMPRLSCTAVPFRRR